MKRTKIIKIRINRIHSPRKADKSDSMMLYRFMASNGFTSADFRAIPACCDYIWPRVLISTDAGTYPRPGGEGSFR